MLRPLWRGLITIFSKRRSFPSLFPRYFPSVLFPVTYVESCNVNKSLVNRITVCNENVNIGSKLQQAKSTGASDVVLITNRITCGTKHSQVLVSDSIHLLKKTRSYQKLCIKQLKQRNREAGVSWQDCNKIVNWKNSIERTEREETKR